MDKENEVHISDTVIRNVRGYLIANIDRIQRESESGLVDLKKFFLYNRSFQNEYERIYGVNSDGIYNLKYGYVNMEEILFYDDYIKGFRTFALPRSVLEKIDFSNISFERFKANDFDFTGLHNVKLNPQEIYLRDLSGAKLNGVEITGSFTSVNIVHADLTGAIVADKEEYKKILLRQKLVSELSKVEPGVYVKLKYDSRIIDALLFDYETRDKGTRKSFAIPLELASKIDYTGIDFDNFNARHFDFREFYGVKINPQTVYDKDLIYCKFNGVTFIGPFHGAKIDHSDFTGSSGAYIGPMQLHHERDWNHEEVIDINSCKFTDVHFIGTLGKDSKYKLKMDFCDFTGSKDAKIDLSGIDPYSGFRNCVLNGATIYGEFSEDFNLKQVNFTGAKNGKLFSRYIKINPQCALDKDLSNSIFSGVEFVGTFEKSNINGADFTGSKGAVIDLRTIEGDYESTNFSDTKVIGTNGKEMYVSEDGKLGTDISLMMSELLGINDDEVLDKKALEEARIRLIEENRKKFQEKLNELLKLVEASEKLGVDPKHLYCSIPIEKDVFLVPIDDHYEINRSLVDLSLLRFLNLSMIDFSNVKVSGLDFRGSGARINPQTVYKKDLSNGIFDASNIKFFDDFTGVNIEGADFTECEVDPKEKIK
ncbi:MAG: hypothetical protein IJK66_00915 [Bacilli bacterium]|nr:hypothetical protein [Bacilli bacterium]